MAPISNVSTNRVCQAPKPSKEPSNGFVAQDMAGQEKRVHHTKNDSFVGGAMTKLAPSA